MTLVVKRSAVKMWLMAMGGIPLLVISLDVLTNRRITNWLRELLFRPEDTQLYEPRDVIWAWAMMLFAGFIVLWGLKELFMPTKVVECRDYGLALRLNGPFRGPSIIVWELLEDVRAIEVEDDDDRLPMLSIRVLGRTGLPDNPWGARWLGDRELAMLAQDWSMSPDRVAQQIEDFRTEAVERQARARTAGLWEAEEKT